MHARIVVLGKNWRIDALIDSTPSGNLAFFVLGKHLSLVSSTMYPRFIHPDPDAL